MDQPTDETRREIDSQQPVTPATGPQAIYDRIRGILDGARKQTWQAVNTAMLLAYWEIGRAIVEGEQQGEVRAEYGKRLIHELAQRLSADYGKGFDRTNLQHMRAYYLAYPIRDALRRELSWTHYRLLLRVEKPEARAFYELKFR